MTIPVVEDPRLTLPFLGGVYLAVNAVQGLRIVVDGPMCAFYKAEYIQGNHQLVADLQRHASPHRMLHTELDIHRAVMGDEGLFHDKVRQAAAAPDTQALCYTALSSALMIGRDMDRLMDQHRGALPVPLVPVPSRALSGDWLDGYEGTLAALAGAVPLAPREPAAPGAPARVGIVGLMFTRHEGDSQGDALELRRVVEALGARVQSVWLEGQDFRSLAAIGDADLLLVLPHGERAAERLAGRTGARCVAVPLPFGLPATEAFARAVAGALGGDAPARAEAFLQAERDRWAPGILFRAEHHLQGTRWMVADDPRRLPGWLSVAEDLGLELDALGVTARPREGTLPDGAPDPCTLGHLRRLPGRLPLDGAVSNSVALDHLSGMLHPGTCLEWGYPCFGRHPVMPEPTLGLPGLAVLAELMCRARQNPWDGHEKGRHP